jgi:hypothetical protein
VAAADATVTAVTTLASPTLSSAHLTARFMPPPDLGRLARPLAMIAGPLMSPMMVLNRGILIFLCSLRGSLNLMS